MSNWPSKWVNIIRRRKKSFSWTFITFFSFLAQIRHRIQFFVLNSKCYEWKWWIMHKWIFISMSQPRSETTPTLSKWCCAGTGRKRNGRWCANSGAPPPTSPTRCGWWGSRRPRGAGGPPCLRRGWASALSASSSARSIISIVIIICIENVPNKKVSLQVEQQYDSPLLGRGFNLCT